MLRLVALGLLGLALSLPGYATAGERAPRPAAPTAVAESECCAKREPVWAMPARKAEQRRHFSRDVDPRPHGLLAIPGLTR
jgi:hypothetical protein